MGRQKLTLYSLAGLVIFLAAGLPAFGRNQHRLSLFSEETHGTTTLAAGDYLVRWETHSPEATVTFIMNRKEVGKLMGKVVERDRKFDQNTVIDDPGPNGTRRLVEIDLGGTNKSIVFSE
jgi:hypothetical protein